MLSCSVIPRGLCRRRCLAVVVVVGALTTACTSTVGGQSSAPTIDREDLVQVFEQVEAPQLGRCVDTVRGGTGPLGPPPTLTCSEPHGGEIAKIVEVPAALDGDYPTSADLDSDAWSGLLYGDEGCGDYLLPNTYLGARDQDRLLAGASAYLPKKSAWEGGARWVACVVEYRSGTFEDANAPGRMAGAMRGPDADAYRVCWFGPQVVYDIVACSQPHEAEPTGDYVSAEEGAPYPADPLARQPLVDECSDRVADYLARDIPDGYAAGIYLPTEEEWASYPEAPCVILDSDGRRRTGSAVNA